MTEKPYIKYHKVEQHTDEWRALRCGLLTASEMKLIITPTLKIASNDKERGHLYELVAQRINNYVEPSFLSFDMERGLQDEIDAKHIYNEHYGQIASVGFITNKRWGFVLGYSPDGVLMDQDGLIEIKSRKQKYQLETIIKDEMPDDYMIQVQTGLLVSEREFCDFISYCGGMPMFVKRIYPDRKIQDAIVEAATVFHEKMGSMMSLYHERLAEKQFQATERKEREGDIVT